MSSLVAMVVNYLDPMGRPDPLGLRPVRSQTNGETSMRILLGFCLAVATITVLLAVFG